MYCRKCYKYWRILFNIFISYWYVYRQLSKYNFIKNTMKVHILTWLKLQGTQKELYGFSIQLIFFPVVILVPGIVHSLIFNGIFNEINVFNDIQFSHDFQWLWNISEILQTTIKTFFVFFRGAITIYPLDYLDTCCTICNWKK